MTQNVRYSKILTVLTWKNLTVLHMKFPAYQLTVVLQMISGNTHISPLDKSEGKCKKDDRI